MNHVLVDRNLCLHDGICVETCPTSVLELQSSAAGPLPSSSRGEQCLRCGHCVSVCRTGALSLTFLPRSELRLPQPEDAIKAEQAAQLLQSRRSVRAYRDKLVPQAAIARALDVARFAPSGMNLQPLGWTVLSGQGTVHALAQAVRDFAAELLAKQHPMAERLGFRRFVTAWDAGRDTILRAAPHVVIAHGPAGDGMAAGAATIAMTYFQLAAEALGLGTCWAGYLQIALSMDPPLARLAGIPEGRQGYAATMMGYAKHRFRAIPPRKPLDVRWLGTVDEGAVSG